MQTQQQQSPEAWWDPLQPPTFVTPSAVKTLRTKLLDRLCSAGFVGTDCRGQEQRVAAVLVNLLPGVAPGQRLLQIEARLLRQLQKPLSLETAACIAADLAGWQWHWVLGYDLPGAAQEGVWCFARITDCFYVPGKPGLFDVCIQVRAGPNTGIAFTKRASTGWLRGAYSGCSRRNPLEHPDDLAGCYAFVWLRKGMEVGPEDVHYTSACKAFNRDLRKGREHCPHGFIDGPCHQGCPKPRDLCQFSRHTAEWRAGRCRNTAVAHSGFITPSGYCASCLRRGDVYVPEKEREYTHEKH